MNPKISIIMPVYNAEKYLSEMIDSIINQTFTDFELIAINDGSTDRSLSILHDYSKRDSRIIVIDKPNTGVSDTRNIGLSNAQGEYVCFVDADDVLSDDYLSVLYGVAIKNDADMVSCCYITFRGNCEFYDTNNTNIAIRVRTSDELLKYGILTTSCTKIIKRSRLIENKITFPDNLGFGEDLFFSWKTLIVCESIWIIDKKLYGYRMTEGSSTKRIYPNLYEQYKLEFRNLKSFAKEMNVTDELNLIDTFFVKRMPIFMMMIARERNRISHKIQKVKTILKDDTILSVLSNDWDTFSANLSKKEKKLYTNAKNENAILCLFYGYKLNLRMYLSSVKSHLGGKK